MTTEIKRLIQVRVDKGAVFKRDGYGKKRQLSDSWRKPRGQHNKQREQKKAKGARPKPGFGSPIAVRGMHPSGFFEILISSAKELEGFEYRMKMVYSHFPIQLKLQGNRLEIANFLGEKKARYARIEPGVTAKIANDEVVLTGIDRELVGTSAANIEHATHIRNRDPRVFQDGIYIVQRG